MKKVETYTWPRCPYSINAKRLLEENDIPFRDYDISGDETKRSALYQHTGQRTVPFIFIGDEFIGGYSELAALIATGKLDELLE